MTNRRTLRTLNAGSVIGGFRIYSTRQGGLRHCSRLVSVPTTKKPCYLSQTAGLHRFLILYKDYNTEAFLRAADFRVQRYEEKTGYSEKNRENQRKSEKIGELSVNFWDFSQELSVNFLAYPQELSENLCSYP